jgi:hypothetical protein
MVDLWGGGIDPRLSPYGRRMGKAAGYEISDTVAVRERRNLRLLDDGLKVWEGLAIP